MRSDLFESEAAGTRLEFAPGAVLLRGFAAAADVELLDAVAAIARHAPFRHMLTPGAHRMSVAMTNCGALGWVSDTRGYRYDALDPQSGLPWPPMPASLTRLARQAAQCAGFDEFVPDACLINRYEPGARLTLHQDRNERDYSQPIVSVSLGLPATFLFGGVRRGGRTLRLGLQHGDVVVWGGEARLRHHGVMALAAGEHPLTGAARINLTLRKAG